MKIMVLNPNHQYYHFEYMEGPVFAKHAATRPIGKALAELKHHY